MGIKGVLKLWGRVHNTCISNMHTPLSAAGVWLILCREKQLCMCRCRVKHAINLQRELYGIVGWGTAVNILLRDWGQEEGLGYLILPPPSWPWSTLHPALISDQLCHPHLPPISYTDFLAPAGTSSHWRTKPVMFSGHQATLKCMSHFVTAVKVPMILQCSFCSPVGYLGYLAPAADKFLTPLCVKFNYY